MTNINTLSNGDRWNCLKCTPNPVIIYPKQYDPENSANRKLYKDDIFNKDNNPTVALIFFEVSSLFLYFGSTNEETIVNNISVNPTTMKGKEKPPTSYRAPPISGPIMNPRLKHVFKIPTIEPTLSENSMAIIVNVVHLKDAWPIAAIILIKRESPINVLVLFT